MCPRHRGGRAPRQTAHPLTQVRSLRTHLDYAFRMSIDARSSRRFSALAAPGSGPRGMARTRGGWEARLRPELEPRVVRDARLGDFLLIATPLLVAAEVARVERGQVITMAQLRQRLAARHGGDRACPLTTGIFAAIVAGAVGEDLARQRRPRWPIWRLVGADGLLNANWPLDARYRAALLREEGRAVTASNGSWKVLDLVPRAAPVARARRMR